MIKKITIEIETTIEKARMNRKTWNRLESGHRTAAWVCRGGAEKSYYRVFHVFHVSRNYCSRTSLISVYLFYKKQTTETLSQHSEVFILRITSF